MASKPNQKVLNKYLQRIEVAEKWRDGGYRDKWERFYKRYRNYVDQLYDEKGKVIKDRSNISIPYSYTMVETILPRLVESLFAARPYVTVKGRPKDTEEYMQFKDEDPPPWEQAAERMQQLLDYQQNIAFDIQDEFHIGLKTMAIYGTTVAYVGWKYDERPRIRKEMAPVKDKDGQPIIDRDASGNEVPVMELQGFQQNETLYDDPELHFIDLGLFFVDPHAEDIDDARYCGHTFYPDKAYLQRMHDLGIWHIDWKKIPKDSGKRNEARDRRMGAVGLPTSAEYNGDQENSEDVYEVHCYWEDDKEVVIINRGYIAMDSENPYWHKRKPYVKDVYCKVPGEFYGIGVIETIEDLQDELNTERNQRIDNRSRALRRMYTQRRAANITPQDFSMKNGGRVLVDSHDDIKEWEHKPLSNDTFTQESIIKQDMRDATGAHDVVMGTSGGSSTATETMTKDNNASMRFKLVISSVEKRLLVGVSRFMIQLNQQFIDSPRVLEAMMNGEEQLMMITPEEIQGEFRLSPYGSSVEPLANKEAYKQRMVEMYGIVANDPFMQQFPDKRRNLLKKVFESFDIMDTDDLLPTDEELAGQMQGELIDQIIMSLPPELGRAVMMALSQSQSQVQPQPAQVGDGSNTSMQAERGMQLVQGGG